MNLYRLFAACFLKSDTKGSVIRIRIDMVFQEQFANNKIRYRFRYPNTALYMRPYIKAVQGDEYDILASEEYIEKQRPYFTECTEDAYVEYKALIELTSKFLLPRRSCIFHAVAFCWKGYAWLLTGPSGAGKTTQYKKWKYMNWLLSNTPKSKMNMISVAMVNSQRKRFGHCGRYS